MKPRFYNQSTSSFLLWLDHEILQKGSGFENVSSYFYDVGDNWAGLYTYANPYGAMVADTSVSGATVMTGVYVSGIFSSTGQNGLVDINYDKGQVYFNTPIDANQISGTYALKEFNISLTQLSEADILFEQKYHLRPYINQTITGLNDNTLSYPLILVRRNSANSEPFAFGGLDQTEVSYRCIILAENLFQRDAVVSILADSARGYVPLLNESEFPYNWLGGTTGEYNYDSVVAGKVANGNGMFIESASESQFNINIYGEMKNLESDQVSLGILDLSVSYQRYPRQA